MKYKWLSNWFSNFDRITVPVIDEFGIEYLSVERAFQASKSLDKETRLRFIDMSISEGDIKKLGRAIACRPDWEEVKISVMTDFVSQKYDKNLDYRNVLIRSSPWDLVEWNMWRDNFWGVCICDECIQSGIVGLNHLGLIHMQKRKELIGSL